MGKNIISHKLTSVVTITRLGVQLGHVQGFFPHTLHLIPTVHLIGKSDKCQYPHFIEEIETQGEMTCWQFYHDQVVKPSPAISIWSLHPYLHLLSKTRRQNYSGAQTRRRFLRTAPHQEKWGQANKALLKVLFSENPLHCNTRSKTVRAVWLS